MVSCLSNYDVRVCCPVPSEPVEGDKEHPRRQKIWEAWNYCSVHSKSVEVLYENLDGAKVLSKVHFRYDPDVRIWYKL